MTWPSTERAISRSPCPRARSATPAPQPAGQPGRPDRHRRRLCAATGRHHPAGRDRRHHLQIGSGPGDPGRQTAPTTVGQIELATFFNEAGLEAIGDNLLLETAASGAANIGTPGSPGFGKILQGYTEASNVDSVAEISALIIAQRAYEMNSKVISTADNMLSVTAQVKS